VDLRIDLDAAAEQIVRRRGRWEQQGITVGDLMWRDVVEGSPPVLKTVRSDVRDGDSAGVALSKDRRNRGASCFSGVVGPIFCT